MGCKGKRIRFQRQMLQSGVLCKGTHVQKWQSTHEKRYLFSCTQTALHMQTNLYLSFVTNDLSCTLLRSSMQGPLIILRGRTVLQYMPSHNLCDQFSSGEVRPVWMSCCHGQSGQHSWTCISVHFGKHRATDLLGWRCAFENIIPIAKLPSKRLLYTVHFFRWLVNY